MASSFPSISLRLRAFEGPPLEAGLALLQTLARDRGLSLSGPLPLPGRTRRWTLLRSPHVHKTSREQFEIRTRSRLLTLREAPPEEAQALVQAFLTQAPPGLALRVTFGFRRPSSQDSTSAHLQV